MLVQVSIFHVLFIEQYPVVVLNVSYRRCLDVACASEARTT